MLKVLLILIGLVSVIAFVGVCAFVYWLNAEFAEDQSEDSRLKGRQSLLKRLFRWMNKPTKRIEYRRDKLGRFRKIWRG